MEVLELGIMLLMGISAWFLFIFGPGIIAKIIDKYKEANFKKGGVICVKCKHHKIIYESFNSGGYSESIHRCFADEPATPASPEYELDVIYGKKYLNNVYLGVDAEKRNKKFNCKKFEAK